jgi:hypothetical protein
MCCCQVLTQQTNEQTIGIFEKHVSVKVTVIKNDPVIESSRTNEKHSTD